MKNKNKDNNLKVIVTNPKSKKEYNKMIDDLNKFLNEKYSSK